MNKYSYCFLIAFYLIISSCDLFTEPDVKNSPTEHILSNFDATIVDYDSVRFSSHFDIFLESKSVKEIIVSRLGGDKTNELEKIIPVYVKTGNQYRLDFEVFIGPERNNNGWAINREPVEYFLFTFNMKDGSQINVEKKIDHYKYPYESSHSHFSQENLPLLDRGGWKDMIHWEDFDIKDGGNTFYFQGGGIYEIYIYDLIGDSVEIINLTDIPHIGYKTVDKISPSLNPRSSQPIYIAVQNNIIYYDENDYYGECINRIDLDQKTSEYFIRFGQLDSLLDAPATNIAPGILGLEANNENIFVLMGVYIDSYSFLLQILRFSLSGTFIESIDWEGISMNLESYNNILYSYAWDADEIICYDLNTNSFLESKPAPSGACGNGFEIVEGRFYYSDWGAILSIPLEDIEN